jgi:hypothetical protein
MYLKGIALAGSILVATAALAHEKHSKGPNGGTVTHAGKYHVEMVANGTVVDMFLMDADDNPVLAKGMKATAILLVGGKSQRVALQPADGSRLSGKAAVALPAKLKGAVQLTGPDGKTAQGKFN